MTKNRNPWPPASSPKSTQMQINLDDLERMQCICGGKHFQPVNSLHFASALQSPTGQETLVANPDGFLCVNCNEVNNIGKESDAKVDKDA